MARGMLKRLKARLGELWWYTALLFLAQRLGDVLNMAVGLWLVPRWVPQEELGAVLPITSIVAFLALPVAIVTAPFQKFMALFDAAGEKGKVKALVRDVFVGTFVMGLVVFLLAAFVLPFCFTRLRVATGSLGVLILAVSIMGAVSGVFGAGVAGIRRFGACAWCAALGAPLRVVAMVLAMPFRPLSGYVVGQGVPHVVYIAGAFWALRDYLRRDVVCRPYWRAHGRDILRYAVPIAVWTVVQTVMGSVEALVIRHRLTDFESAGYYLVTRFSEIAGYVGLVFPALLFPLVAARAGNDATSRRLLGQSLWGAAVCGVVCTLALAWGGRDLLGLTALWRPYQVLAPHMTALAGYTVLVVSCNCLITYELAQSRFRFLWYTIPLGALKCLALLGVTGGARGLPAAFTHLMQMLAAPAPDGLSAVIAVFIATQAVLLAALATDYRTARRRPARRT